ncbi:MAG: HvfC/BufC family peptide modification chaperone [Burkholderiales bacterium]
MHSLRDLQRTFAASLLASAHCDAILARPGMDADARLGIYRNNVFSNYREALRAVYPVIERLVGSEFFRHAADRFIATHESVNGYLHRFGEGFADFLQGFPGAEHLVFLSDTAHLEWLIHESFHAADHAPLALRRLAEIGPGAVRRPALRDASGLPPVRIAVSGASHLADKSAGRTR